MTTSQRRPTLVAPLPSGDMSGVTLAERVIAARTARGMNASALQAASGLSARTVRDIESGNDHRRYAPTTLARLDGPLGWAPGTAWRTYVEERGEGPVVGAELAEIRRRLATLEEEPAWARELVDLARLLSMEDRFRVFDLVRRLGERSSRQ